MLKFFSARDDENESLLGEITEEEGDNPSLQDSKQHWLNRPCLLVLRDGDVAKPRLGCGQIGPESPSKATSGAAIRNTLKQYEQKASEHPTKTTPPSKLDENSCTMTAISTWRELESSSTLVPSPTEAAWPEEVEENEVEGKKPLDFPSKEDSVVEEKELEESRQEQQEHSCSSNATEAPASVLQQDLNTGAKMVRSSEGKEMSKVLTANGEGATKEGTLPDNESQLCPTGILSKDQGGALGEVAPLWVPDAEAQVCMKCGVKFTFTKRRHHCRACGKVFCALCSNLKFKLTHLDGKEGRVCVSCHSTLVKRTPPGGRRKVWFADEILTNQQSESAPTSPVRGPSFSPLMRRALGEPDKSPVGSPQIRRTSRSHRTTIGEACGPYGWGSTTLVSSSANLIPLDGLPPILTSTGVKGDYTVEEKPSEMLLIQELESGRSKPVVFVLNANLLAMVNLVNYVNRKCWYVTTKGMHAVGQAEVVILLQCLPDEKTVPKDIFTHFVQLYQEALSGNVLSHLSHSFFTQSFLGSKDHGGFLYISPSFQSLQDLLLPNPPYLFGILIQKWETPWAKVFPIRLMLRLGAEYRFYPCPLFSVRFRKPLFGETGHTIMNLLADFRNYQYTLPVVKGLVVDMEVRKTSIKIPSNHYNELMKAMNKSNEHVLAMGACFNDKADSHLVCVQNDDGNYQTQAISIHHQPRKVTGACFFVFSGALKASSGFLAKTSIVEDGVMIQITAETMDSLRQALRDMKDFTITCGKADQEESQEQVQVVWTEDDHNFNKGVISPIDGKSMESITSVKIFHGSEFKANGKVIRWTEVFFLQSEDQPNSLSDPADHSRLAENVARAFCMALCPHLKLLKEDGMAKLGLRVTLDSDQVGYLAGSNGQPLLPQYLSDLDSALIPVIHSGACQLSEGPVVMELVFYILEIIS
uniref:FYVE-type domain-containing protein n=1 Tax=Nothobranchius korthausae TaxID=1143690 RepID=A0A1A8FH41_9TELE